MRNVVLLGASGQIGAALRSALAPLANVHAPSRAELDCTRLADVDAYLAATTPTWVVNAAAYTRVDDAEDERELAATLNAALPARLAKTCARLGAALVHYSTDYVFSGDGSRPYREDDLPDPVNWYGVTKLDGERAVLAGTDRAIVLRTSWVYGLSGANFLRTMLRLARERREIRVVADQQGAPTWSHAVAHGTVSLLARLGSGVPEWRRAHGIFHMAAAGQTTWHGFATRLLALDPHRSEQRLEAIIPISTSEYFTKARRPAYSVLNCDALAERFGIRLPAWEAQLDMMWRSGDGEENTSTAA